MYTEKELQDLTDEADRRGDDIAASTFRVLKMVRMTGNKCREQTGDMELAAGIEEKFGQHLAVFATKLVLAAIVASSQM